MAITRLQLKDRIKSARGLTRARDDGLLDDTLLNEAVRDAQELVVKWCNLFPVHQEVALEAGKYEYPVQDEWLGLKRALFIDASGNRLPIQSVTYDDFIEGRNPETDVALEPVYYAFPKFQRRVIQPWAQAPPNKDFIDYSFVTSDSIRTVYDTGINFGRTRTGRRISPGDLVYNLSDGNSYGIVEVLDMTTVKRTASAGASTSATQLVDGAGDFINNDVQVDDLITVRDSDGIVITYGFVTDVVSASILEYEDVRGAATVFAPGDTYRVGVANIIRLSSASPHRGLRGGINNRFSIASASATISGTTFTDTRATGSGSLTSVSAGQVAVASGGSHGEVSEVGDGYLDVECWVGGVPSAGEQVTVHTADKYHVETRPAIERVMLIGPTPTNTDALGTRSILLLSNRRPIEAQHDWEELEVGEEYRRPLFAAGYWMAAELSGLFSNDPNRLGMFKGQFISEVETLMGDVNKNDVDAIMSPYLNSQVRGGAAGRRYQGERTGITWNVRSQLG
jgi:hypothetical protein